MIRVIVPLIVTAVIVFSIVDIVTVDPSRVRGLPKWAWVGLVVILPIVGSVLWFMVGRESLRAQTAGGPSPRVRKGPTAPDDDNEFLGRLSREAEQEERIRDLEKRLSELDDDKPSD